MKIRGARVAVLPTGDGRSRACLVRLETDTGLNGLGIGPGEAASAVRDLAGQVLVGEDPRAVVMLGQRLADRAARDGDASPPCAAAVLDMALWDLKARINEEPLWRTLGGAAPRARVHVPATGGSPPADTRAFLLEAGEDADGDGRRLREAADAVGEKPERCEWYLDLGERFSVAGAIEHVRALERSFDVTCVLASARGWDDADFRRLSSRVLAAVGNSDDPAGEWFAPRLDSFALDVVRVDPGRRGITGALQLSDAAYGYELPVLLCPTPGDVGAHLASVMPSFMGLAAGGALPAGITSAVRFEDGLAVADEEPGLGFRFEGGVEEQAFGAAS